MLTDYTDIDMLDIFLLFKKAATWVGVNMWSDVKLEVGL